MARVVSMATRIKISRSLKGNRNAYRGGPKRKLTAREKVANINAATAKKRKELSQVQLENRKKAAMRLRRQARAEEAGIKPNAPDTKPLPTAKSIKNDPDIKEAAARANGRLVDAPVIARRKANDKPDLRVATGSRQDPAVLARNYRAMHGDKGVWRKVDQLQKAERQGKLNAEQRDQLGELERLDTRKKSPREEGVPAKVTRVSEPKSLPRISKTAAEYRTEARAYDAKRSAARIARGDVMGPVSNKGMAVTKSAQAKGRKVR